MIYAIYFEFLRLNCTCFGKSSQDFYLFDRFLRRKNNLLTLIAVLSLIIKLSRCGLLKKEGAPRSASMDFEPRCGSLKCQFSGGEIC